MPDRRRQLGLLLVGLLALGLVAFAVFSILRWMGGGGVKPGGIAFKRIALSAAPQAVRDAAQQLATSRVGYAMPMGGVTYAIISTGAMGERVEVAGARQNGSLIELDVRSGGEKGDRLVIIEMKAAVADTRMVQFDLDGYPAMIPALVNRDNLSLMALPDKEYLITVKPRQGDRVGTTAVDVSGYARIFEGQFSITVYTAGKGRVLGETQHVMAAIGAPNWGSFRAIVPVAVPPGITDGIVLLHDAETGVKLAIPVKFGSK